MTKGKPRKIREKRIRLSQEMRGSTLNEVMKMKTMGAGYACIGLLVGMLCGLTSAEITMTLFAALFAFMGGTATYLVEKKLAAPGSVGVVLINFSLFCLLGLLGGITIKENRLLSFRSDPKPSGGLNADSKDKPRPIGTELSPYLKAATIAELDQINLPVMQGLVKGEEGYKQQYKKLWEAVENIKSEVQKASPPK